MSKFTFFILLLSMVCSLMGYSVICGANTSVEREMIDWKRFSVTSRQNRVSEPNVEISISSKSAQLERYSRSDTNPIHDRSTHEVNQETRTLMCTSRFNRNVGDIYIQNVFVHRIQIGNRFDTEVSIHHTGVQRTCRSLIPPFRTYRAYGRVRARVVSDQGGFVDTGDLIATGTGGVARHRFQNIYLANCEEGVTVTTRTFC